MKNFAQERFDHAQELIYQAGKALYQAKLEQSAISEKSGHQDLVTRWDQQTEQFLRRSIMKTFAEDSIVGEEYSSMGGESAAMAVNNSCTWYIDPIDGTTNFINQHRHYAISIGCYQAEEPLFGLVLDVEQQELYWACRGEGAFCNETQLHTSQREQISQLLLNTPGVLYTFLKPHSCRDGLIRLAHDVRGVRSMGSVALELCAVAAGESDLLVAMRSSPWDHNAARIILNEAGGSICALSGQPLPLDSASPILAANSQSLLQKIWREYCQGE